jgi:hypothetical protein
MMLVRQSREVPFIHHTTEPSTHAASPSRVYFARNQWWVPSREGAQEHDARPKPES